jgi:hypothetical protein
MEVTSLGWVAGRRGERYYRLYFEPDETAAEPNTMEEYALLLAGMTNTPNNSRCCCYPARIAERMEDLSS